MHDGTLYHRLEPASRAFVDDVTVRYRCTAQEVREPRELQEAAGSARGLLCGARHRRVVVCR